MIKRALLFDGRQWTTESKYRIAAAVSNIQCPDINRILPYQVRWAFQSIDDEQVLLFLFELLISSPWTILDMAISVMVDGSMWAKRWFQSSAVFARRAVSESLRSHSLYKFPVIVVFGSSFGPFEIQKRFEWKDVVNPDLSKVRTDSSWYPSFGTCCTFLRMHLTSFLFSEIRISTVPVPNTLTLLLFPSSTEEVWAVVYYEDIGLSKVIWLLHPVSTNHLPLFLGSLEFLYFTKR